MRHRYGARFRRMHELVLAPTSSGNLPAIRLRERPRNTFDFDARWYCDPRRRIGTLLELPQNLLFIVGQSIPPVA